MKWKTRKNEDPKNREHVYAKSEIVDENKKAELVDKLPTVFGDAKMNDQSCRSVAHKKEEVIEDEIEMAGGNTEDQ